MPFLIVIVAAMRGVWASVAMFGLVVFAAMTLAAVALTIATLGFAVFALAALENMRRRDSWIAGLLDNALDGGARRRRGPGPAPGRQSVVMRRLSANGRLHADMIRGIGLSPDIPEPACVGAVIVIGGIDPVRRRGVVARRLGANIGRHADIVAGKRFRQTKG